MTRLPLIRNSAEADHFSRLPHDVVEFADLAKQDGYLLGGMSGGRPKRN